MIHKRWGPIMLHTSTTRACDAVALRLHPVSGTVDAGLALCTGDFRAPQSAERFCDKQLHDIWGLVGGYIRDGAGHLPIQLVYILCSVCHVSSLCYLTKK